MKPEIVFIGLGEMGLAMASKLVRAGHSVIGFDRQSERCAAFGASGGVPGQDLPAVLKDADIVMTSVSDGVAFLSLCREVLLPHCHSGQIVIDLGTVSPPDVRATALTFTVHGTSLLDVPVSGGPQGAREGTLRMFAGGDRAAFEKARPLLEVLGAPGQIDYVGPSGNGQLMKAVNQLGMGLIQAAVMECVAFGVNAGLNLEQMAQLVGGDEGWRQQLRKVCMKAQSGDARWLGVKHGQLPYFLREADAQGFPMPLSQALHAFLQDKPQEIQEANRRSPSLWRALTQPH
ncbi:MAG: NAD(P)-dependent oxidoreductase [Opitutales bacterium]